MMVSVILKASQMLGAKPESEEARSDIVSLLQVPSDLSMKGILQVGKKLQNYRIHWNPGFSEGLWKN